MNAEKIFRELLRELSSARKILVHQKGQRRDPSAPNFIQFSWDDYCAALGISRQTADYWLRTFAWQDETLPICPSIPPAFVAAVRWLNRQGVKQAAGKRRRA